MLRSSVQVATLVFLGLPCLPVLLAQKAKPTVPGLTEPRPAAAGLTCYTIVQAIAAGPVFLQADVPKGATDLKPVFAVKGPHDTDPWVSCPPGATTCNGAFLFDTSHPSGADSQDGALHYAGTVGPLAVNVNNANPLVMSSPRYVRLVSQYTVGSATCLSQATFEVADGGDYPTQMAIPVGKTVTRIMTFMRELPPADTVWVPCDDWKPPPTGTTVGRNCNILKFGYNTFTTDAADQAQTISIGCSNKIVSGDGTLTSGKRRACRIQFQY
jgi:hypothetical protein